MTKKIRFGKTIEVTEVEEKLIQKEFENNLSEFEDGMKYIASFVGTAVGTVDTLALDEDKQPVIIEFKAPGVSATDALIQALDYYAWCSEGGNFIWLEKLIRKVRKDALGPEDRLQNNIRIIIVASEFEERLKRAVGGIQPDTMLVSYKLLDKGEGEGEGEVWLLPVIEINTSQVRRIPLLPKTENDHFSDKENQKELYEKFKAELLRIDPNIKINPAPQNCIRFIGKKTFCWLQVKKGWLRLDLPLTSDEADSERYVWKEGWGGLGLYLLGERKANSRSNKRSKKGL